MPWIVAEEMQPGVGLLVKEGLPLMAIGMISIFIVIGVVILSVYLLGLIGNKTGKKKKN